MGAWTKNKVESSQINGGQEYTKDSNPSLEQLNAITNNAFYAVNKADEALEKANSAFENNGTVVSVGDTPVSTLNFTSDPQSQINGKASQGDLNSANTNISNLDTNKANKNLSNVTFPQLTPDGQEHTASGYTTFMSTDGNKWYIKSPIGLKIMGGYVVGESSTQQTITVNFETNLFTAPPFVFKQTGYGGYYTNPVSWDYFQVWDVTKDSFKTPTFISSSGGDFKWIAIGI